MAIKPYSTPASSADVCLSSLVLSYSDFDFLLLRDAIFASLTLDQTTPLLAVKQTYLQRALLYHQTFVPIIECHHYLQHTFHVKRELNSQIVLILAVNTLQLSHQQQLRQMIPEQKQIALSNDYIAVCIGGQAQVQNIAVAQLRLTPTCLRKILWPAGVLGLRFIPLNPAATRHRIQYLLDLEQLIFHRILN